MERDDGQTCSRLDVLYDVAARRRKRARKAMGPKRVKVKGPRTRRKERWKERRKRLQPGEPRKRRKRQREMARRRGSGWFSRGSRAQTITCFA